MNRRPIRKYRGMIGEDVAYLEQVIEEKIDDPALLARLKQSLNRLADVKFALEESSIVAITDDRGVIQYVNEKFCELSKFSREELIGQDHRIINSGHHSKEFFQEMWQTISSGEVWHGEVKNRGKDGKEYWVDMTIVPFLDDEDKPYQYLAIRNEITQRKRAEQELKEMMVRVMEIQEEERKRISRELHDGFGQSLFSLLIKIDHLIDVHPEIEDLSELRHDVSAMMEDIRGLAREMRPSVLDDLGVVPAIRSYIETFSGHFDIQVELNCQLTRRLGIQKETVIYRVIQEAMTNVAKYANVDHVTVTIEQTESGVEVYVTDQGTGFDMNRVKWGVGIFSMKERARRIGGDLEITSAPGKGTEVRLFVPIRDVDV